VSKNTQDGAQVSKDERCPTCGQPAQEWYEFDPVEQPPSNPRLSLAEEALARKVTEQASEIERLRAAVAVLWNAWQEGAGRVDDATAAVVESITTPETPPPASNPLSVLLKEAHRYVAAYQYHPHAGADGIKTAQALYERIGVALRATDETPACEECKGTGRSLAYRGNFEPTLGPCQKCSTADKSALCLARRVEDDTPLPRCDQYPRCPCGGPEGYADDSAAATDGASDVA
jgi:hypothetical protein